MDEKNYHSRLLDISQKLDKVIEKLKASYIDNKLKTPWWLWLLSSPLRDIGKIKDLKKGIFTFLTSKTLMSILPIITAACGPYLSKPLHLPIEVTSTLSFLIGYIVCISFYFTQITNFKSEHFHLGAYKALRKQEYEIFKGAFLDPKGEFYFKGVYDYVTNSKEGYRLVENLIQNFLTTERTEYKERIHYLEEQIRSLQENIKSVNINVEVITDEYDNFIASLISERDELLDEFEYVIELIKDLNSLLFRVHNKGLQLSNLDILTGFTLYELRGDMLVQIEDVRTSGITATEISLNDPKYAHYGVVKVIKDHLDVPYYNQPYPGHEIVSFKMKIDQMGTWVYNFHFDDSNMKAWKLLKASGIIESKEIYRLIHALCLLSHDFKIKNEEGAVNQ